MDRARAKDWLIGATGVLVVLGFALVTFWLVVSVPSTDDEAGGSPRLGAPLTQPTEPPADLQAGEVWLEALELGAETLVTEDSVLHDVRAHGMDVVAGEGGLVASWATVDATVPFHVVAAELGGDSTVSGAGSNQARVVRAVEVLGRELRVAAVGTIDVEDGRLVVEPDSIDIGGPDFLADALGDVAGELVTIEHDVEGLPEGVVLHDVTVQRDGFRAHLRGQDVQLVQ